MLEHLPPCMETLRVKQHLWVDAANLARSSSAITKFKGVHTARNFNEVKHKIILEAGVNVKIVVMETEVTQPRG